MDEIKILILDDNDEAINSYQGIIKRINRDDDNSVNYIEYTAKTLIQAKKIIKYNILDTAIIDLNLCADKEDPDNADGNRAIEEIINSFRMPIFIVSGELNKLEENFKNNNLINTHTRDDSVSDILTIKIPRIFFSKTIRYFSRDGFLEKEINDFYWNYLSKTIDSWNTALKSYQDAHEKILSRHTVSCLNEKFYVNGNIGSFDQYHPGEMYIIPQIKEHYHTGDLIAKDGQKYIILNPACDIVNTNKLNFYLLAELIKLDNSILFKSNNIKEDKEYVDFHTSLNSNGKNAYEKYQKNTQGANYHYLPKFDKIDEDYLIDFQNLQVINIGNEKIEKNDEESKEDFFLRYLTNREVNIKNYERIASISSPFLKDIIARFSAYYARQGQPNLL